MGKWRGEWGSGLESDRLRRPYFLIRVGHVEKNRDRKETMDIRKYSVVNRTIKNWNQLAAETLGAFHCKRKIFRKRFGKANMNWVK